MKNNSFFMIMILFMVMVFGSYAVVYGNTEVALEAKDGILYRQITNGRVGANCYDETGTKVIARSRLSQIFDSQWDEVAKLDGTKKTYSISCYPYRSLGNTERIAASFTDQ